MSLRKNRYAAFLASFLALSLAALLISAISPASAGARPAAGRDVGGAGVTGGTMFGGTLPLVGEQSRLGRKLAIVRLYYTLGQHYGLISMRQVMSAGGTVLASLDVSPTRGPSYAAITAGRDDKEILGWLKAVEHEAVTHHLSTVYVSFQHEANSAPKQQLGTPAQFVAAWDHVHRLAAKAHLNVSTGGRLRWVLILMRYSYLSQRPPWARKNAMARDYWPGVHNVDVIAADGYNRGGCRLHRRVTRRPSLPSVTPGSIFDPVLAWARRHGNLPVFLSEWASATFSAVPGWQARYISQMKSYLLANPQIRAVMYWDQRYGPCRYSVAGNGKSLAALAAMGRVLRGRVPH
jgi:hypothetical protein